MAPVPFCDVVMSVESLVMKWKKPRNRGFRGCIYHTKNTDFLEYFQNFTPRDYIYVIQKNLASHSQKQSLGGAP